MLPRLIVHELLDYTRMSASKDSFIFSVFIFSFDLIGQFYMFICFTKEKVETFCFLKQTQKFNCKLYKILKIFAFFSTRCKTGFTFLIIQV